MRSALERGPLRDLGVGGSRSPHAGARSPWLDSDGRGMRRELVAPPLLDTLQIRGDSLIALHGIAPRPVLPSLALPDGRRT